MTQLLSHELALQSKLRSATTGLNYSNSKQDQVDRQQVLALSTCLHAETIS